MKPFYLQPLCVSEFDDRPESVKRAEIYRELEWVRYHKGYQFGWTARTYKEIFGCWPEAWMQTLLPAPASPVIEKWVRSKLNAFKKTLRGKNGNAGGALLRGDAKTARSRGRFRGNGEVEE